MTVPITAMNEARHDQKAFASPSSTCRASPALASHHYHLARRKRFNL